MPGSTGHLNIVFLQFRIQRRAAHAQQLRGGGNVAVATLHRLADEAFLLSTTAWKTPGQAGGDAGQAGGDVPYAIYNIGGGQPENLLDFVQILQEELVRAKVLPADYDFEAHKQLVPMQPGDVPTTYADASALERDFGFTPKITLREGLRHFAEWYKEYYG